MILNFFASWCDPCRDEMPLINEMAAAGANSGFDLYEPNSGATQLNISVSYFNYSVSNDPSAPVRMGRGMIACNTPALQQCGMLRTTTASQINDESLKKTLVLSLDGLSSIRTSDIQSACLLNSMSIRAASYLRLSPLSFR